MNHVYIQGNTLIGLTMLPFTFISLKKKETIYSKLVMMSERRRTKLSNTSKVVSESCILQIQTAMFKDHLINQRKIYCTSVHDAPPDDKRDKEIIIDCKAV